MLKYSYIIEVRQKRYLKWLDDSFRKAMREKDAREARKATRKRKRRKRSGKDTPRRRREKTRNWLEYLARVTATSE